MTPLIQVKSLPAGAGVGYGLTHTLRREGLVGLVPIGYGDGYLRCLSNRATMRVGGRDAPAMQPRHRGADRETEAGARGRALASPLQLTDAEPGGWLPGGVKSSAASTASKV
jgi:hypothetical protein